MSSKTRTTLESMSTIKYRLIAEGAAVGLITGIIVSFFRWSLLEVETYRSMVILNAAGGGLPLLAAAALLVVSFLLVYMVIRLEPMCGGSGIPNVKAELSGKMRQNWLRILPLKIIGGVAAIGAGMSLGREGPSVQIGAMVGKGFASVANKLRTEEKLLMTCGAGAGLAGAFSAPLAGTVFSLEELHKNFSTEVLLSSMSAAVASDFVSSYVFGLTPVFDVDVIGKLPLNRYWMVIILGLLLGALGVVYNRVLAFTQDMYAKIPNTPLRLALPYICIVILAILAPDILGSGHELVGKISDGDFISRTLLLMLALKFVFSMISYGCGAPGGIFMPLLVLGAIAGGAFSEGIGAMAGFSGEFVSNFVVLGMAGMFASIIRAPITGIILITEMTGDFNSFLPLTIVSLTAYLVADLLGGIPVYEQLTDRMLSKGTDSGMTSAAMARKVILESDVHHGSFIDGREISKMLLPKGCLVVSVQRGSSEIVPDGTTVLTGGDKLLIICSDGDVRRVEEKLYYLCKTVREQPDKE